MTGPSTHAIERGRRDISVVVWLLVAFSLFLAQLSLSPRSVQFTSLLALQYILSEDNSTAHTRVSLISARSFRTNKQTDKPMNPQVARETCWCCRPSMSSLGGAGQCHPLCPFTAGPLLSGRSVSWWLCSAFTSVGPGRTQSHRTRWPPLCPLGHSSTPRRCRLYPGSCALGSHSECSRCAHTCQRSRWPGTCRRD